MKEEWRNLKDTYYDISSQGRIRRVLLLKPSKTTHGYLTCGFRRGRTYNHKKFVHLLVAEAFLGSKPEGLVVNHKDGDKTNNRPSNLEYITRAENSAHAAAMGLYRSGTRSPKAVLTEVQVKALRQQFKTERYTFSALAAEYGVSKATIHRAVRGVTYSSIRA